MRRNGAQKEGLFSNAGSPVSFSAWLDKEGISDYPFNHELSRQSLRRFCGEESPNTQFSS